MPKILQLLTVLTLLLGLASCVTEPSRELSFEILEEGIAFSFDGLSYEGQLPPVMVIAHPKEISPPAADLEFVAGIDTQLEEVDYNNQFVILFVRDQRLDDGVIEKVFRKSDEVVIQLTEYEIGPGNYVVQGYTRPYKVISVKKDGEWERNIRFVLEREGEGIIGETIHYVP